MKKDPSDSQLQFLADLMKKLGYDEIDLCFDWRTVSRERVSQLITQLKQELYGTKRRGVK
jgi:hypothetical protein